MSYNIDKMMRSLRGFLEVFCTQYNLDLLGVHAELQEKDKDFVALLDVPLAAVYRLSPQEEERWIALMGGAFTRPMLKFRLLHGDTSWALIATLPPQHGLMGRSTPTLAWIEVLEAMEDNLAEADEQDLDRDSGIITA